MLILFVIDCQNTRVLRILCEKKETMSRRDLPKHPVSNRYNVPRPGEYRPGNENHLALLQLSTQRRGIDCYLMNHKTCFFLLKIALLSQTIKAKKDILKIRIALFVVVNRSTIDRRRSNKE